MSYILDALKKAERDRPAAKVPTLKTVHQPPAGPARRLWPWFGAVVVLVNAGVLIWLMRSAPMPSTGIPASSPVAPAASAPTPVTEQAVPARPADPAPRVSPSEAPAAVATAPPPPSRPQPERTPAVPKRADAVRGPSVALTPAVSKAEPRQPKPADARAEPAARPALEKPASPTPAPPVPPIASAPNRPGTAPVAPSPPVPAERGRGSLPASGDMSPGSQEVIRRMRLQVVVYSDVPTERLVFIDNHKYVEGQSIDGKVLVESIMPDGAILIYQGKRFKLRASAD
jgi:general secretion pathway protein B